MVTRYFVPGLIIVTFPYYIPIWCPSKSYAEPTGNPIETSRGPPGNSGYPLCVNGASMILFVGEDGIGPCSLTCCLMNLRSAFVWLGHGSPNLQRVWARVVPVRIGLSSLDVKPLTITIKTVSL